MAPIHPSDPDRPGAIDTCSPDWAAQFFSPDLCVYVTDHVPSAVAPSAPTFEELFCGPHQSKHALVMPLSNLSVEELSGAPLLPLWPCSLDSNEVLFVNHEDHVAVIENVIDTPSIILLVEPAPKAFDANEVDLDVINQYDYEKKLGTKLAVYPTLQRTIILSSG